MAIFNIKRHDTAPAIEIAMVAVGTEPKEYWDAGTDKPDGYVSREIKEVRFILKDPDGNMITPSDSQKFTGLGKFRTSDSKTILTYSWADGDTAKVGLHTAEFEVLYENDSGGYGKKRTFPANPGDTLQINVLNDANNE